MSSDPSDLQPQSSPGPTPTPSQNPMSNTPSTTSVSTGAPTPPPNPSSGPPSDFVVMVNTALRGRLGDTKWSLIPAADKKALIEKILQDPTVSTYYITNHSLLGNQATGVTFAGQIGNLINQVLQGQGNDPTVAIDYTNMLQAAGVPLTASEQAGLAGATASVNATV